MAECQQAISSREYAEWLAYYNADPFGPERNDLAAAIVAQVCATGFAGGKRRFKVTDFLPDFGKKRQAEGEMRGIVGRLKQAWSKASGHRRQSGS